MKKQQFKPRHEDKVSLPPGKLGNNPPSFLRHRQDLDGAAHATAGGERMNLGTAKVASGVGGSKGRLPDGLDYRRGLAHAALRLAKA